MSSGRGDKFSSSKAWKTVWISRCIGRVEAAVARRLPHRSGLAAFPHPALLMSYPVSGRSSSPDVNQPWGRERVGAQKSDETVPRHSALLSAPPYGSMPGSDGLGQEAAQAV